MGSIGDGLPHTPQELRYKLIDTTTTGREGVGHSAVKLVGGGGKKEPMKNQLETGVMAR